MFSQYFSKTLRKKQVLPQHVFTHSAVQALLQKESLFDLPNIEQVRTIENNPRHWLTTDNLQIHLFQYHFFQNLTLNTKTEEQLRLYFLFLRKFCRLDYQLI